MTGRALLSSSQNRRSRRWLIRIRRARISRCRFEYVAVGKVTLKRIGSRGISCDWQVRQVVRQRTPRILEAYGENDVFGRLKPVWRVRSQLVQE